MLTAIVAMRSYRCIRLACQSRALSLSPGHPPASRLGHSPRLLSRSRYSTAATAPKPGHQGDSSAEASENHSVDGQDSEISAFKLQRLRDLAKAQEAESPLISEPYPRLKSDPNKMSNTVFRSRFAELEETKRSQTDSQKAPNVKASASPANPDAGPWPQDVKLDRTPTNEEFEEGLHEAEREATVLRATLTGRVR